MAPLEVLVVGAGIAGPVFAYWLKRGNPDASITILERFPAPRVSGQAVDIKGVAVDIVKNMGLVDKIKAMHTTEQGIAFVNGHGKPIAKFGSSGDDSAQSFTSEFEILRGDLAKIFYDATKDSAKYVFDEYVTSLEELTDGKIEVEFANNHLPKAKYDLVVAADGMVSRTRRLVFGRGPNDGDYLKRLGQYAAYFTIPGMEKDDRWALAHNSTKGRLIFTRPDPYGTRRVFLFVTDSDMSRFDKYDEAWKKGTQAQKDLLKEEYKDVGFDAKRALDNIDFGDDFYYQPIAQVKMDRIVKGHFALLGDAGYCPSPISGMGTPSAIVGAYVLAGEISNTCSASEIPAALERYQGVMKPLMDSIQKLFPGAPHTMAPQTRFGIFIMNTVISVAAFVQRYMLKYVSSSQTKQEWKLPVYGELLK